MGLALPLDRFAFVLGGIGRRADPIRARIRRCGDAVAILAGLAHAPSQALARHRARGARSRRAPPPREHRLASAVILWAISDLHVGFEANRLAVETLTAHPDDWLILAGDTGDTIAQLERVLGVVTSRFKTVIWTPGNHDLWTPRQWPDARRGEAHYQRLVEACRRAGVLTPEDAFAVWPGVPPVVVAPCFTLYDYSFAPANLTPTAAVAWAAETQVQCADEVLLSPAPYPTREAWCAARVGVHRRTARRHPRRIAHRHRESFSPAARSRRAAPHSPLHDLVRHHAHRVLAHPLSGGRGGVRSPSHAQHPLA